MADSDDDLCPECKGEDPGCEVCGGNKEETKPKRQLPPVPFSFNPLPEQKDPA